MLALGARRVIAIEHDERAIPALQDISARYPDRLEIVHGDAMTFDPRPLLIGERAKIVANLPYNIATHLLVGWLTTDPWPPWYDMMVLMFQREVGERIVAREDEEAYRPARRARQLALRDQDPVRHRAVRLRAAAEGHVLRRATGAARRRLSPAIASCSNRSQPPPSASAARCCGKA